MYINKYIYIYILVYIEYIYMYIYIHIYVYIGTDLHVYTVSRNCGSAGVGGILSAQTGFGSPPPRVDQGSASFPKLLDGSASSSYR